jgi:GT2 family glycosyltransferase
VPPEEVTPELMDRCIGPAAARLHAQTRAARGSAGVVHIGVPVRRPAVSVIIPLYRNLGFLRFQLAAFAADPALRGAELIYVLDSPEQDAEAEHLLRGLHVLHDLPLSLVVMPGNHGYAAANNAAAHHARAPLLLLLNSDVVPARPGWLAPMRAAVAVAGVAASGPKLLFDDGSIQHAGLYFTRGGDGTWFNAHYHKGMPGRWPAAQRARRVPGVTGAALLVRRAAFEQAGGVCEDYIIGDYEDSDLCLRLRAAGNHIAYVPQAELFHFERRSIRLNAGYTRTLAAQYNRRLHHVRWDGAIAGLMARPAFRSQA